MKKLLFITQLYPSPSSGGTWKSWNLIQGLLNAGYEVDVCCFEDSQLPRKKISHKQLRIFSFKKKLLNHSLKGLSFLFIQSVLHNIPLRMVKYSDQNFKKTIEKLQNQQTYSYIFLDMASSLQYIANLKTSGEKIYIEHNIETDLVLLRAQNSNLLKKFFWYIEMRRTIKYEAKYLQKVEKIWAISKSDKKKLEQKTNTVVKVLPISLAWKSVAPPKKELQYLIFLGLLSWPENEWGLCWFLDNVWITVKRTHPNLQLLICGAGASQKLMQKMELPGITYQGFVKDLNKLLRDVGSSAIGIVPILSGSGIRVKILTYLEYGIPVISTKLGSEGINPLLVNIANTQDEFAEAISHQVQNFPLRKAQYSQMRGLIGKEYSSKKLQSFLKKELG